MDGSSKRRDLRRLHVLVVDDDAESREMLATILEGCGAVVTPASSALEALGSLRYLHPDLVVSDLGMPHEDGFWFAREVRMLQPPAIPMVALTGFDGMRREAWAAGFSAYLVKPFDMSEFCTVLRRLGFDVGDEALASPPFSWRFQPMPIPDNTLDVRGHPICQVCDRPITPEENVVLGESMMHGHCASQFGDTKTARPVERRDTENIKRAA